MSLSAPNGERDGCGLRFVADCDCVSGRARWQRVCLVARLLLSVCPFAVFCAERGLRGAATGEVRALDGKQRMRKRERETEKRTRCVPWLRFKFKSANRTPLPSHWPALVHSTRFTPMARETAIQTTAESFKSGFSGRDL